MGLEVVDVDASPDQICAAQSLGLDARLMSEEDLRFDAEFDAVFSNAAMHWMIDVDAVVEGCAAGTSARRKICFGDGWCRQCCKDQECAQLGARCPWI